MTFELKTGDPGFDPTYPVLINGYRFIPCADERVRRLVNLREGPEFVDVRCELNQAATIKIKPLTSPEIADAVRVSVAPILHPTVGLTGTRLWGDQKYPPVDPLKFPRVALVDMIVAAVRKWREKRRAQ